MSDVVVTHNPDLFRYQAHADEQLVGTAEYTLQNDTITFTHTNVVPGFEGEGVGGALAQYAMDHVSNAGTRKVVAECEFIRGWLGKHPDYARLLAEPAP